MDTDMPIPLPHAIRVHAIRDDASYSLPARPLDVAPVTGRIGGLSGARSWQERMGDSHAAVRAEGDTRCTESRPWLHGHAAIAPDRSGAPDAAGRDRRHWARAAP